MQDYFEGTKVHFTFLVSPITKCLNLRLSLEGMTDKCCILNLRFGVNHNGHVYVRDGYKRIRQSSDVPVCVLKYIIYRKEWS